MIPLYSQMLQKSKLGSLLCLNLEHWENNYQLLFLHNYFLSSKGKVEIGLRIIGRDVVKPTTVLHPHSWQLKPLDNIANAITSGLQEINNIWIGEVSQT